MAITPSPMLEIEFSEKISESALLDLYYYLIFM